MEHLETQVSELRSFVTPTPGPPPASPVPSNPSASTSPMTGPPPLPPSGPPSSAHGDNSAHPSPYPRGARSITSASGVKRKSDADADADADEASANHKQQRSKRNRYISIACNECKRRKIKCNGETPCQRCGNLNLLCLYAPNCHSHNLKESEEFKQMSQNVARLQEQVETLFHSMSALRRETIRLAPLADRMLPLPQSAGTPSPPTSMSSLHKSDLPLFRPPPFRGPTSMAFTVNVAKNTLHNMGYAGPREGLEADHAIIVEDTPTPSPLSHAPVREAQPRSPPPDPLWDFDKDEMVRLCRVHEEEVGIMYPVLNINDVIHHARALNVLMEAARKHPSTSSVGQDESITDIKTLELKIIMCCALVVEEHGYSAKALRLWESIQPIADRMLMSDAADVVKLPFLALVGGYRFLSNDEVLAWRVMGQVARLCLEMGLHRRDGIAKIEGKQERKNAVNTFWSAYVLDRRWSFGTGFPFVVHDDKIDPELPYPEDFPYLVSMITFSKLGTKIWKLVDYFDSVLIRDLKPDDFESLDREILDWYDTVPEEVRITSFDNKIPLSSRPSYNIERLQIWTRLRLNQIRIWLYTPVLHSASSITQNPAFAQRAVDLAKETIQYLTRLNNETNVYRRIQVFYHHFLTSAIGVLFLASTHAPLRFSSQCRKEFHMALELIKDMSAKSWVSQRLWRTIKSLNAYAPRLGLQHDADSETGMTGVSASTRPTLGPGPAAGVATPGPRLPSGLPGSLVAQSQTQETGKVGSDASSEHDKDNGLRLRSEMSKMFDGFTNGHGAGAVAEAEAGAGAQGAEPSWRNGFLPGGSGVHGDGADPRSVYLHMKEMF